MPPAAKFENIEAAIHLIRGQKIMLDADLARIYGVTTKRLNEAVKRNRARFPADFAFVLRRQELAHLRSQIATSNAQPIDIKPIVKEARSERGGLRYLPWAFTEHGAIMLASVLKSAIAVDASVRVVRAFVRLREMISANRELSAKLAELEKRLDGNDEAITNLFGAIRQLLAPPAATGKREIGFHVRETSPRYRLRRKRI